MNPIPLVEMSHISVAYDGRAVLPDESLTVNRGDFLAISGPNGGGKTTLLRVMLRLLRPDSGSVTYFTADGRPDRSPSIGYLPQKSNIDVKFPITVEEVIRSGLLRRNIWRHDPEDEERFRHTVELTGTADYLDRNIGVLSGGQLQRTLLGRAIISDPELIVLDEPLSYVDKRFEHQIYSIMEDLAQRATIVLVSHEMSVISEMATRHVIVDHGLHDCTSPHHHGYAGCDDPFSQQ